jgi:hypothetical protein
VADLDDVIVREPAFRDWADVVTEWVRRRDESGVNPA